MAHPDEKSISFTHRLLDFPALRGIITDTHLRTRNRVGPPSLPQRELTFTNARKLP
jgi:hypothetical protein